MKTPISITEQRAIVDCMQALCGLVSILRNRCIWLTSEHRDRYVEAKDDKALQPFKDKLRACLPLLILSRNDAIAEASLDCVSAAGILDIKIYAVRAMTKHGRSCRVSRLWYSALAAGFEFPTHSQNLDWHEAVQELVQRSRNWPARRRHIADCVEIWWRLVHSIADMDMSHFKTALAEVERFISGRKSYNHAWLCESIITESVDSQIMRDPEKRQFYLQTMDPVYRRICKKLEKEPLELYIGMGPVPAKR